MQCFVYLITCINIIPTVTAPGLLTQISSLELLNSIPLGGSKISPNVRQQANVLAPRVYDCSRWYCMVNEDCPAQDEICHHCIHSQHPDGFGKCHV
ncbi:hypothetical protein I7I50_05234 [Histoplasma capsulatum G186AR]|uniref:Uncharacterized protein n=1 Tax=Ajellomyces capsulatus TaxID=5037 RepID=A0A8H7Z9G1_AJECA|nr:hypothetical protein I7I52_03493 [Histoplasma capsulatum]QSS75935.1 hypothetical protein I7I50_05234 [Histoplasma capsulatum G186AR]